MWYSIVSVSSSTPRAPAATPGGGDRAQRHVGPGVHLYLARTGYTHGPLFRASINGTGGPLSYDAAHHRWRTYCTAAGVSIGIHQLRHAHATELNRGVSIEAVRRRLGQASHGGHQSNRYLLSAFQRLVSGLSRDARGETRYGQRASCRR
jgi:integrase